MSKRNLDFSEVVALDIEALSTFPSGAIVQLSAARYDNQGSEDEFNANVYYDVPFNDTPFSVDMDTLMWWLQQSKEAISNAFKEDGVSITEALTSFYVWLHGKEKVTSTDIRNLSSKTCIVCTQWFDIPIWRHAHSHCFGVKEGSFPIAYNSLLDIRSLDIRPRGFKTTGIQHNALDDAKNLREILKAGVNLR